MNKILKTVLLFTFVPSIAFASGTPHYISVTSSKQSIQRWSVDADLYAGNGRHVYHWQEQNHKPGSQLRWNYTDGGDRGWLDINVHASPVQTLALKHLPLNKNHCFYITDPVLGSISKAIEVNCPN